MQIDSKAFDKLHKLELYIQPGTSIIGTGILGQLALTFGGTVKDTDIGFASYIQSFVNSMSIGNYCSLASGVTNLFNHSQDALTTSPVCYTTRHPAHQGFSVIPYKDIEKTVIGSDVWIGQNVLIKSGVKIGDGAIIGAGSIVTHDVDPFSVVVGSPAKFLKMRFNDKIIELIQRVKWYNYDWRGFNINWNDKEGSLYYMQELIQTGRAKRPAFYRYSANNSYLQIQHIDFNKNNLWGGVKAYFSICYALCVCRHFFGIIAICSTFAQKTVKKFIAITRFT